MGFRLIMHHIVYNTHKLYAKIGHDIRNFEEHPTNGVGLGDENLLQSLKYDIREEEKKPKPYSVCNFYISLTIMINVTFMKHFL